jgi:hypothetical protein
MVSRTADEGRTCRSEVILQSKVPSNVQPTMYSKCLESIAQVKRMPTRMQEMSCDKW